jgi:hypothetical protein
MLLRLYLKNLYYLFFIGKAIELLIGGDGLVSFIIAAVIAAPHSLTPIVGCLTALLIDLSGIQALLFILGLPQHLAAFPIAMYLLIAFLLGKNTHNAPSFTKR